MRLATIRRQGGVQAAAVEDGRITPLDASDVADCLRRGPGAVEPAGPALAVEDVEFAPLVPNPAKVICVGLNYRDHILEMGQDLPAHPSLFAKFARALIGSRDEIVLPAVSEQLDWEAELALVIGREVSGATEAEAKRAIAGYTIMNDVSVRDWQWRTSQWLQGKTFERTTPLGPVLVPPAEVGEARDLAITCEVDGEVMQESRTSNLVFGPEDVVRYVSSIVTLDPGDVVATGTPGGVGAGRRPAVYLKPGSVVRTAVEGLGECVNRVRV